MATTTTTSASDVASVARRTASHPLPMLQAFLAEFIGTFVLVFAVFGVIHRTAAPGSARLVIGFVLFAAIIRVAPSTGASINPARTTGAMLVQQILGGQVAWQ